MTEQDRGGSVASDRLPTHLRMPGALSRSGVGFRAVGSVPRVSEDSTDVRVFQEGWHESWDRGGVVGRNGAGVEKRCDVRGVG